MLTSILLITVLSLISGLACSRFLHDPYYDLKAPAPIPAREIPNMTFDSRGLA